ncbi:1-pyrroline-5-carboxylate dehydrogenase [Vibrio sp. ZSDE26]|uniref:1-pyrroline-5-carboxylate dehydrogenase n=1 Tax=Vibrio amylolyticus TaxID=2847292 RepID=A0A9X2BIN5_9VIBR|nr:1-pyrroline-5-carboxylate dehydrogenase [Vibrio amylolyticus]MCK6264335.1 1-pyrroline-5-carboxylate dehydrogenase [Vibrio amylolyticus]
MMHQITRYSDSYTAWASWNQLEYGEKSKYLLSAARKIEKTQPSLSRVVQFHEKHAARLLKETHQLVGPTGETNELYTTGRGVALVIHDNSLANSRLVVIAHLTAALLAGNSVIVCSDDTDLVSLLESAFQSAGIPSDVLQFESLEAYSPLLETDIRSVGYIGTQENEIAINRTLSKKTGAIVLLSSETDMTCLSNAQDPALSLRFITERTRTINITAVGGNATLLELGSDEH